MKHLAEVSARIRFFLLLAMVTSSTCPVAACDDTVLSLITGENVTDRLARQNLDLVRVIRALAADLNAMNKAAASDKLADVMEGWIPFSSAMLSDPTTGNIDRERLQFSLSGIASNLGLVRKLILNDRLSLAHDLLEPIVLEMCILSAHSSGQEGRLLLLRAELSLNMLKPGFMDKPWKETASEVASFVVLLDELQRQYASAARTPLLEVLRSRAIAYRDLLQDPASRRGPLLSHFAELLLSFGRLRDLLLMKAEPTPPGFDSHLPRPAQIHQPAQEAYQ
ncbi:hypothetical protein KBA41_18600 [Candidatus Ozemobacteraceae bacterium]|nr:hypothetical protein [Candidatus Ozemobacteraceae bacterium]